MALTKRQKEIYNQESKIIKGEIEEHKKKIGELEKLKQKYKKLEGYIGIAQANESLKIVEGYLKLYNLFLSTFGRKSDDFLYNAKKEFFQTIMYLEKVFGKDLDSLTENEERLDKVRLFDPKKKLNLIRRLKMILDQILEIGMGSKWHWSFVDLYGKFVTVLKNIISFKELQAIKDPREQFFYDRQELLDICKHELIEAAKKYLDRFDKSTKSSADITSGRSYLEVLRQIASMFGTKEEVESVKNKIAVFNERLEALEKEKKKGKKKKKKKKS